MLKETIYKWIRKIGELGRNPNFENIMIKLSDNYKIKDIENALEELREEGLDSEINLYCILFYEESKMYF